MDTQNPTEKKKRRPITKHVISILLIVFIFTSGYVAGRVGYKLNTTSFSNVQIARDIPVDKNVDFSQFWKVWDLLGESYIDKAKLIPQDMVYGAIKGMVAAVGDPYTVFLAPRENEVTQEDLSGAFEGIGIQIGFRGNQLAVIAPLPETPAEKAGLLAGDYIVAIKDDTKDINIGTSGITLPYAVELIRGPRGTQVTLFVTRDGVNETLEIPVVRENIDVPSVTLEFVEENGVQYAHLKLLKFGGDTLDEWNKSVADIISSQPAGIVLDLRNNPGGYLQAAVDIAGSFLPNGSVVVIEEDANGTQSSFKTNLLPKLANTKTVILVNAGSASASEILAGALRDQSDMTIIGEKTFGKGTIQEPLQLEKGSGLHLTVAKWLTPGGVWVNDTEGLVPDVEVADNTETDEDEQLQSAIDALVI